MSNELQKINDTAILQQSDFSISLLVEGSSLLPDNLRQFPEVFRNMAPKKALRISGRCQWVAGIPPGLVVVRLYYLEYAKDWIKNADKSLVFAATRNRFRTYNVVPGYKYDYVDLLFRIPSDFKLPEPERHHINGTGTKVGFIRHGQEFMVPPSRFVKWIREPPLDLSQLSDMPAIFRPN